MSAFLTILYPLSFVFVLSIVVIVHEFGHFWVARRCGVKVEQFSLGFGKVLWSRKDKKGTEWKVCLIPLGGYVQMFGDADASSTKTDEKVKDFTEEPQQQKQPGDPVAHIPAGDAGELLICGLRCDARKGRISSSL